MKFYLQTSLRALTTGAVRSEVPAKTIRVLAASLFDFMHVVGKNLKTGEVLSKSY